MNYFLNAGQWGAIFAVPDAVVDDYIKLASGSAVKVLLYILRNNGKNISEKKISSALNINTDDVRDAFNFWQEVGILGVQSQVTVKNSSVEDNSSPSKTESIPEVDTHAEDDNKTEKTQPKQSEPINKNSNQNSAQNSSSNFNILPTEIEKLKNESKEIRNLFSVAQSSLGEMITHPMTRSLIWQHEYLGLKADVILMLLTFCASINKKNIAYIEAIAIDWYKNDINTIEKAEDAIERIVKSNDFYSKVYKAFGLTRQPTENQKKFFDQWYMKGYSTELIDFACEKMIDTGKKLTANYVNGILENWRKKGITTKEEALKEGKNYKKEREPSYDVSRLEKKLAITFSENIKNNKGNTD